MVFALYIYDPPYNRKQSFCLFSLTYNGQIEMRGMNEQIILNGDSGARKSKRSIAFKLYRYDDWRGTTKKKFVELQLSNSSLLVDLISISMVQQL